MNAKTELLNALGWREDVSVLCAQITVTSYDEDDKETDKTINLQKDYTEKEYKNFLQELNFDYNYSDIDGTVWFEDGSWLSRDYDFDNWTTNYQVEIPEELIKK